MLKLTNVIYLALLAILVAGCSYSEDLIVLSRKQAIDDLDYLVTSIKTTHPNPFMRVSEEEFGTHARQIKADLGDRISRKDLSLMVARLLALIRDEHTRLYNFPDFVGFCSSGGKTFPLKLMYRSGSMTVVGWPETIKPEYLKKGDTVVAINGKQMESLLRQYGKYVSAETELQRRWILEGRLHQFLWLIEGEERFFELALMNSNGEEYIETILATAAVPSESQSSSTVQERFTYDFYLDKKVCLFNAQSFSLGFFDDYVEKLKRCIDQMRWDGTSVLIFDIRGNTGGHWKFTWELLSRVLPKSINAGGDIIKPKPNVWDGHLVLLCDRSTYSAAVYLAVIVKDCNVGIIGGEETGGRASYFGNVITVRLPNSGLSCQIATKYFLRPVGFDDGRGVLPDLPLDVTLEDRVLVEKIYNHVKMKRNPVN